MISFLSPFVDPIAVSETFSDYLYYSDIAFLCNDIKPIDKKILPGSYSGPWGK